MIERLVYAFLYDWRMWILSRIYGVVWGLVRYFTVVDERDAGYIA